MVGTGTGVGKTHATRTLASALVAAGVEVAALKPIESGVQGDATDFALLAAASSFHVKHPPYAFPEPLSPHLAARLAGAHIRIDRVTAWVRRHPAPWTFVETAGALLTPLTSTHTNLDLLRALRPDAVLLVAMDRLGVLHDVRACMLALRDLPPTPTLILLQAPPRPDSSTGTNATELARLHIADVGATFPRRSSPNSPIVRAEALHALRRLAQLVGRQPP